MSESRSKSNAAYFATYYAKNKKTILQQQKLADSKNKACKNRVMVGKRNLVELPSNTPAILHTKFIIDESSKTGLRWCNSSVNRIDRRGKEAGIKSGSKYYKIKVMIDSVEYHLGVAAIIMIMFHNKLIEPGMCVNHKNKKCDDNRLVNLEVTTVSGNNVNRSSWSSCFYKNVYTRRRKSKQTFYVQFRFLGLTYRTTSVDSENHAFMLGWELITSGKVPLNFIKSQSDEWKDGTYLQRALAEYEKQGVAVTPPKFKTLYEYIAFVEGEAA